MRVVTMALIDMNYFLLSFASIVLAFATTYWIGFAYIHSLFLLILLYLAVVRIPLVLNWSRNLYGSVFTRIFFFQIFAIFTYAIIYNSHNSFSQNFSDYWDALYFSATTWTTLGYGDITPTGEVRLLSSIQALTGLSTLPVFASVIWLYCEQRLWDKAQDEKNKDNYHLELDNALGLFKEVDDERTKAEQEIRNKIKLNKCNCDNSNPYIEKYYNIVGFLSPFPRFVVRCRGCGNFIKPQINAYLAAWKWNIKKHN